MSAILKKAAALGLRDQYPDYLNAKLKLTNMVAGSLLLVAIGYAVFSLFHYPSIAWLPAAGLPVILLSAWLGYMGAYNVYRLLIVLVPVTITFTYHEAVLSAGDAPLSSTLLLQGAFSLLPFIIFDLRDKVYLTVAACICFFAMVFFTSAEGWLEYGLDDSIFRFGIMHQLTVATAVLLLYLSVYTLSGMNAKAERAGSALLEKGKEQTSELLRQREEMESNLKRLEEAQEEERKRAWASEGFSTFGNLMRQMNGQKLMYDQLLAGVVKYVGANQGGLFIVEKEGDSSLLRLYACYAYGRKKFKEQDVLPGQGLVGQVYLEKDYIYRTDIPQGYTYITSGLGEATPCSLLIVPLMSNEKVEGVLEIASFKPFEGHIIHFLMKLGEDIASGIGISRMNELTRSLLAEAQEQTEEMRAQEEEMRQNMEELQATQEEMQRKEREYLSEIEKLRSQLASGSVGKHE